MAPQFGLARTDLGCRHRHALPRIGRGHRPASAHVHASSDDAVRGGMALVTFEVPNESTTGAATTALTVDLSNVSSVQTEAAPGWTVKLDRDAASGTVHSVTWTAAPKAESRSISSGCSGFR